MTIDNILLSFASVAPPPPPADPGEGLLVFMRVLLIVLGIVLVGMLLLQVRGGGLNLLGSADSSFRARRGLERWLFRSTIIVAVLFIVIAVVNIRVN